MDVDKKCMICNTNDSKKWIERENIVSEKAYFCSPEHYNEYKKRSKATGVCEFC